MVFISFVVGVCAGVVLALLLGNRIEAEVKKGFALLAQTVHERVSAIEASLKSKV